tara:strand:- start:906 stop:1118 length:213 start_codon:yes stop_codon:yes gene_type:complete
VKTKYTPEQMRILNMALPAMKQLIEAFNTCAMYCEQLDEKGLAFRANMIAEHATDFTKELEKKMEAQDEQ